MKLGKGELRKFFVADARRARNADGLTYKLLLVVSAAFVLWYQTGGLGLMADSLDARCSFCGSRDWYGKNLLFGD